MQTIAAAVTADDDAPSQPLTRQQVESIVQAMKVRHWYRLQAIADRHGVSISTVRRVYRRYTEREARR